eukprot:403375876
MNQIQWKKLLLKEQLHQSRLTGVDVMILVYDITSKDSFNNLQDFLDQAKEHVRENTVFVVAGNKEENQDVRVVAFEEGQSFANENGASFIEVSAKTGNNVNALFYDAGVRALKKSQED